MPEEKRTEEILVLCSVKDARDFGALRIEREGLPPLAVLCDGNEIFVLDDTCTHGEASLSEGTVKGGHVECPWHSGSFCLRTGSAATYPAVRPVRIYAVVIKDDQVCIRVHPSPGQ